MRIKSQFTIILLLLLLCPLYLFARTKNFSKQTTETIPSNQSQDQVVAYLTQKLTREAIEEAGIFVSSELKMENGNISKEEITNIAGAVAQIKVDEIAPFVEKNKQYVRVKVNISVDTDSVQAFLHNTQELTQAKQEAKQLRQRNLELEALLKNANKQQFEQTLSDEVKQQVALQQKHSLEYKQLALKAQENFLQTKQERLKQESQREAEIAQLKQRLSIQQESLALEEKQLKEKFKLLAQQNPVTYTSKMNIQEAFNQASLIQPKLRDLMDDYDRFLAKQQESISSYFAEQKELQGDFAPKNKWETTQEFQERQQKNKQLEQKIYAQEQEQLFTNEIELLREFTQASQPMANALSSLQTQGFLMTGERAQLLSMDKVNADKKIFEMKVKYNKKNYTLSYDFSNISLQTMKILYQQAEQFFIEPLFSIRTDKKGVLQKELTAFSVKQVATKEEQVIPVLHKGKDIPEIVRWEKYLERYLGMKEVKENPLPSMINEFKNSPSLSKYTKIISGLERANSLPNYEKLQHLASFRQYLKGLEELDKLPVQIIVLPSSDSSYKKEKGSLFMLTKKGVLGGIKISENLTPLPSVKDIEKISLFSNQDGYYFRLKYYLASYTKEGKLLLSPEDEWAENFQFKKNIKKIIGRGDKAYILTMENEVLESSSFYPNNHYHLSEKPTTWKKIAINIIDIFRYSGGILALREEGSISQINNRSYSYLDHSFSSWKNIASIQECYSRGSFWVGITKSGDVLSTTGNSDLQAMFKKWKNIVKIDEEGDVRVGLRSDGKLESNVELNYGYSEKNIKDLLVFYNVVLGLDENGNIFPVFFEQSNPFEYGCSWKDIVSIEKFSLKAEEFLIGIDQKGNIFLDPRYSHYGIPAGKIYNGISEVWNWNYKSKNHK